MANTVNTAFAPQLFIRSGVKDINFYEKAFGAIELRRWLNDDGSIHVAELAINGAMFHLHEETLRTNCYSPERHNGTTTKIGLFVENATALMNKALAAGAKEISPMQDYDYGYRQGDVQDPFGHIWMIEMKI